MKRILSLFVFLFLAGTDYAQQWEAPPEAKNLQNPLPHTPEIINRGQKIYRSLCAACHGNDGKGNVPSMQNLNPKPADLTSETVQKQTDGEIFWKISEGRGLMAAYKNMLSDEERWALVHYIRKLAETKAEESSKDETSKTKSVSEVSQGVEAFPFTYLINARTTRIPPRGFGLNIQHRFGLAKFDKEFISNFMGLDLSANMRFAFEIPLSDRLMVEIGRTRYGKIYDGGFKYLFLRQTADDKVPVSIAVYENVAVTTEKPPVYGEGATFANGTLFEYKFYHRLAFDNQLIVSRKFGKRFSGQITFELVWRNLMPYTEKPRMRNVVFALPLAVRYRMGLSRAISMEIMPNTQPRNFPVSLAYEVASSGNHVFQITLTNSDRFLPQYLFTMPTYRYDKDGFILGFNLIRYF